MWDADARVVPDLLHQQAADVAFLHNKYYKVYLDERAKIRTLNQQYKQLYKLKFEYYTGILDQETLQEKQWKPFSLRVLKTEVPMYLDSDSEMNDLKARIDLQQDKIEYLESIIKLINNRNFQIKNVIDYLRFTNGQI